MRKIEIAKEFAQKCAEALVDYYNQNQGKKAGAIRLIAFRSLYDDLNLLNMRFLIANAIKPEDYPHKMWFTTNGNNNN